MWKRHGPLKIPKYSLFSNFFKKGPETKDYKQSSYDYDIGSIWDSISFSFSLGTSCEKNVLSLQVLGKLFHDIIVDFRPFEFYR